MFSSSILLNITYFLAINMLNDTILQDNCNMFKRMLFSRVHYNKRYIKKAFSFSLSFLISTIQSLGQLLLSLFPHFYLCSLSAMFLWSFIIQHCTLFLNLFRIKTIRTECSFQNKLITSKMYPFPMHTSKI